MAEDIDIEEHDLLDNPIIKQIFPDLSVLKKEIEYDDGYSTAYPRFDPVTSSREYKAVPDSDQHSNISVEDVNSITKNFFNNKIIIGSKKPKIITNTKKSKTTNILIARVKVLLKNIKSELIKGGRFCQTCLVLFPTIADFKNHQVLFHNEATHDETRSKHEFSSIRGHNNRVYRETHNVYTESSCEIDITPLFNEKHSLSNNEIDEVNVMVNINKSKNEPKHCNSLNTCFHCNFMFPSQQSLIEHMYEILNTKKSNNEPHFPTNRSKNIYDSKYGGSSLINEDSTDEVQSNLDINESKVPKQLKCLYRCPVCSFYFNLKNVYTEHLLIKHKLSENIPIEVVKFNSKCKFCDLNFIDVMSYNTHLLKAHSKELSKKDLYEFGKFTNEDLHTCLLHDSETSNFKANKINQKCETNELKKTSTVEHLKINPDNAITKKINELRVMALKIILFKCVECNVHFLTSNAAKNHFDHSKIINTWKCPDCRKLFKQKDVNVHKKQHKYSKYFTVVVVKDQSNHKVVLYKCPSCAVHFKKDNYAEHVSICESVEPKSSYCRICDILVDHHIKIAHENDHKSKNNTDSTNLKIEIESSSQRLIKKSYYKQLFCCDVCKCSIPKTYREDHLINFNCKSQVKCVCEFCGLLLSKEYIDAHRKLHLRYNNLKLQNFIFFHLKNRRKIRPLTEFPKCKTCKKHFIYEHEVENHKCQEDTHVECSKCKIKLSYTAYVLHKPFHNYIIRKDRKKENKLLENVPVSPDSRKPVNKNLPLGIDDSQIYFTCKNCDITINEYDQVIEHCHLHTNLNKIEVDTTECAICRLQFVTAIFNQHELLHTKHKTERFKCYIFDVFYFGSSNEKWLRHVFGSMTRDAIDQIISNAIYKYENRIKMTIMQTGLPDLTLYKCERCQSCIDNSFIYQHTESCRKNSKKYSCKICNISFLSKLYLQEHEENHKKFNINLKSFRIVTFNGLQEKQINYNIAKIVKYHVLHECRYCHIIVDKKMYDHHECHTLNSQNCDKCGLLLHQKDYEMHVLKHKQVNSFNKNLMKVVLIGNKNVETITTTSNMISMFSGIVCDYKLYKCVHCEVCVRDLRSVADHHCIIDAGKFKCPACDFIFDEGKLKNHLKLHETDPDFAKDTVMIETFGHNAFIKYQEETKRRPDIMYNKEIAPDDNFSKGESEYNDRKDIYFKIYKCRCGLNFVDVTDIQEHLKKCTGKSKSKQECFKCGLTFTPNVLFKHLLKHHGRKNNDFRYEILESTMQNDVTSFK